MLANLIILTQTEQSPREQEYKIDTVSPYLDKNGKREICRYLARDQGTNVESTSVGPSLSARAGSAACKPNAVDAVHEATRVARKSRRGRTRIRHEVHRVGKLAA